MTDRDDARRGSRQLQSLERLRSAELEAAQVEYSQLAGRAEQKREEIDRATADFTDAQAFVRRQLSQEQTISPEALQLFTRYAAQQVRELTEMHVDLQSARADSEAAHATVVQRYQQLSIIERLRTRREAEATTVTARIEQRRIDDHALTKLSAGIAKQNGNPEE